MKKTGLRDKVIGFVGGAGLTFAVLTCVEAQNNGISRFVNLLFHGPITAAENLSSGEGNIRDISELVTIRIDDPSTLERLVAVSLEDLVVVDGDTVKYYDQALQRKIRIRLVGVDTAEINYLNQNIHQLGLKNTPYRFYPFAATAKEYLNNAMSDAIAAAYIQVAQTKDGKTKNRGRYGRLLGYLLFKYKGQDEYTWEIVQVNLVYTGLSDPTFDRYGVTDMPDIDAKVNEAFKLRGYPRHFQAPHLFRDDIEDKIRQRKERLQQEKKSGSNKQGYYKAPPNYNNIPNYNNRRFYRKPQHRG